MQTGQDFKKICKIELIREFSYPVKTKCKEQAKTILEYLLNNPKKMTMKKDIKGLFPGEPPTAIERYIYALEFTGAITYESFGPSFMYGITPLGIMMYEVLKEEPI